MVSERLGVKIGEVRGQWEPVITTEQYQRGIDILHKHDGEKSRVWKVIYLLRGLLYVQLEGQTLKMYSSTPTGHSQSYSYYITHAKLLGKKLHIPCNTIDSKIPALLKCIFVDPERILEIRAVYKRDVRKATINDRESKVGELNRQVSQLKVEEARLGRLFITGKMGEDTYN